MESSMSNQPIGIVNRILNSYSIFKHFKNGYFGNAEKDINYHLVLRNVIEKNIGKDIQHLKILDVGCGQLATQIALFTADGADAIGIDMEHPTYVLSINNLKKTWAQNGFERALKSFIRSVLFDKRYFKKLNHSYNNSIDLSKINTHIMSATDLKFGSETFDFIYSDWVFEHIADVPDALNEINRVLNNSGIVRITIHLFPSLSGGHNLDWHFPDTNPSNKVPPWDHLRDNKFPVNTFLNKFRLADYRNFFQDNMNILTEETHLVGEKILTKDLYKILNEKGYSKQDLLTEYVTFLCSKKL
jgi:SAM-dependent methyltransferase